MCRPDMITRESTATHLHRVFSADIAKVAIRFNQKLLKLLEQAPMQIGLAVVVRQIQKFDQIRILEDTDCSFAVYFP